MTDNNEATPATAQQLIATQFGMIPRDQLVYFDTTAEYDGAFTTDRRWYMRSSVKVKDEDGVERDVEALVFARNDVNAQVLRGLDMSSAADMSPVMVQLPVPA